MKFPFPILAIDSSTARAYCAVRTTDGAVHEEVSASDVSHNEELSNVILSVLAKAGVAPAELKGIVIGSGPGSFTGLRIGYSVAKGMAFSLEIPLAEISSHLGIALGAQVPSGSVVVLGDARREELFCSAFRITQNGRDSEELLKAHILPASSLTRLLTQFPTTEALHVIAGCALAEQTWALIERPKHIGTGLLMAVKPEHFQAVTPESLALQTPTYLRAVAAKTIAERTSEKAHKEG